MKLWRKYQYLRIKIQLAHALIDNFTKDPRPRAKNTDQLIQHPRGGSGHPLKINNE